MSSGIKTRRIKVDNQREKKPRFSKIKTGFFSQKTLDTTKLGGKSKCGGITNPPTCKHGDDFSCFAAFEVLFSTSSENKRHGNMETQMFSKRQNQSRKRLMEKALGLCVVANKRERKERSGDEQRDSSWWRNGYLNWSDKAL